VARDKIFLPGQIIRAPLLRRRRPSVYENCAWPGCTKLGDYCRGFCRPCFRIFREHCIANGSWGNRDDVAEAVQRYLHPELPPWEYEGNEQALIEMTEQQEREKQD
jgi:hypothetical protein